MYRQKAEKDNGSFELNHNPMCAAFDFNTKLINIESNIDHGNTDFNHHQLFIISQNLNVESVAPNAFDTINGVADSDDRNKNHNRSYNRFFCCSGQFTENHQGMVPPYFTHDDYIHKQGGDNQNHRSWLLQTKNVFDRLLNIRYPI